MATNQIDLSAKLKAFPYVAPAVSNAATEAREEASELDQFITELEQSSQSIPSDISQLIGPEASPGAGIAGTDDWNRMAVPIDSKLNWVEGVTSGMESAFKGLDKIITILTKIMRIIELFNSSFSSFSKLLVSIVDFAQSQINEFSVSLNSGVHAAVFAPPGILRKAAGDPESKHQLRGGFQGFISRYESSLSNTKDDNRPTYSTDAYVGGMVILLDTESIDRMWEGLKQLASMFDFMQFLPINLEPPPPTNLRGYCGYFLDPAELKKEPKDRDLDNTRFGVKIEWDNSFTSSAYQIYRSRISGGVPGIETYTPSTLVDNKETGEPGLLSVSFDILSSLEHGVDSIKFPDREVYLYNDKDFNKDKPVTVVAPTSISPTLSYIDYDIKTEPITPGSTIEYAYYEDSTGKKVPLYNYYYVIRSCGLVGVPKGPNSQELNVAIKTCNDNYNLADVIAHPQGHFEFLSLGGGKLNNWSAIQISGMVPWYQEIIGILSKFLDTLRGTMTDASDAFNDFMELMVSRIRMYRNILSFVNLLIQRFKTFIFGPSLALLNLPPVKGGMPVFTARLKQAKVPDDAVLGFSGPNGITIGIVLVYGATDAGVTSIKTLSAAFKFIKSLLTEN